MQTCAVDTVDNSIFFSIRDTRTVTKQLQYSVTVTCMNLEAFDQRVKCELIQTLCVPFINAQADSLNILTKTF